MRLKNDRPARIAHLPFQWGHRQAQTRREHVVVVVPKSAVWAAFRLFPQTRIGLSPGEYSNRYMWRSRAPDYKRRG